MNTNETMFMDEKSEYKGCRNCEHQIEPLRACEWLEKGGDGVFHLICPRWEKRGKKNELRFENWCQS